MKAYLIFGGQCFYARGGFNDLIGTEDTVDEALISIAAARAARAAAKGNEDVEWYQIVDAATGEVVKQSEEEALGAQARDAAPHHVKFVNGALVPQRVREAWEE